MRFVLLILVVGLITVLSKQTPEVRLPVNRAGLETLTDIVSQAVWERQPGTIQIYDVEPGWIKFCPNQTARFLLYGSDLWRNASVFLNGVEANQGSVRVLPDMTGLTAAFNLAIIPRFGGTQNAEQATLTVWTQNGSDSFPGIRLTPDSSENCQNNSQLGRIERH